MTDRNFDTNTKEISLKELLIKLMEWLKYLRSKAIIIMAVTLFGCISGYYYAKSKQPIFVAETSFVLEGKNESGGLGSLAGLASMAGIGVNSGGGIFQGDNILELYKSRAMIQEALLTPVETSNGRHLLVDTYIDFNKLREAWAMNPSLKNVQFHPNQNLDLHSQRLRDSLLGTIVEDI
ncbi:MAG TPA: lipopolysaccharide biosynthesis protein, partial [Pedobacter sp.]